MDEHDWLAERFEEQRGHLRAVAYRMLGSLSEADDAVQESWLRLSRADTSNVENLGGWLTTVVGRVCLDMLRSRTSRREEPLDTHVPERTVSRMGRVDGREDGSDLVEGDGEHVMQHEGEPLGGSQGLENDQKRQADRVGQQRFLLRVAPILSPIHPPHAAHGPLRHMRVQRLLPP